MANWLMWIVKGHLIPEDYSEQDIKSVYNGYFKRVWGNHENIVHDKGFEEAWKARVSASVK